jgi:N-carbamoyl-L-amino-acid hydrolase
MRPLAVDAGRIQQWIDDLACISDAPAPAITRVLFSEADLRARAWLRDRVQEAGFAVRDDPVGNLFVRWRGAEDTAPAVATGSHVDAIPHAGRYDGVVGVLGALAAFQALRDAGFHPRRPLELIVFTAEEPTRFGLGCLGSRLLAGTLDPEHAAALRDRDGRSLDEWRAAAGLRGRLQDVRLEAGHYAAFVELHIEQGPLLEREGLPVGVVEKIAGPSSFRIRLTGAGGHAGAVLMSERHDAGLAGAEIALAVERAARTSGSPDTVGTTGVFSQEPNAVNSIPCAALLEVDFRDTDAGTRSAAWARVEAAIGEVCMRRGVQGSVDVINADAPAICAPRIVDEVVAVCADLGLPVRRMISRAYHDALFMARVCPTAMIFIPSRGGVSHRPDEFSSPDHIAGGVTVLAHTLARLAGDAASVARRGDGAAVDAHRAR